MSFTTYFAGVVLRAFTVKEWLRPVVITVKKKGYAPWFLYGKEVKPSPSLSSECKACHAIG